MLQPKKVKQSEEVCNNLFFQTKILFKATAVTLCINFLMRWVFMHIALKGCRPPHSNEPVQFWIGFDLVLIGGSGLNPLGLLIG